MNHGLIALTARSHYFGRKPHVPTFAAPMPNLTTFWRYPRTERGSLFGATQPNLGGEPWYERRLWTIDVPQDSIICYVDNPIWEHLIGSKWVPESVRISAKEQTYHDSFLCRKACLEMLLRPTGRGENISALVPVPFAASWIRPYDLHGQEGLRCQDKFNCCPVIPREVNPPQPPG